MLRNHFSTGVILKSKFNISTSLAWLISMAIGLFAFIWDSTKDKTELAVYLGFILSLGTFYGYRRYKLRKKNENEKTESNSE